MIDGKNQAWCGDGGGRRNLGIGHVTMDLQSAEIVSGVVTQGRKVHVVGGVTYKQYVTHIKIAYSIDGKNFKFVVDGKNKHIIFSANKDTTSKVYSKFTKAARARYVRVYAWDFVGHPSMRVGVMLKARKLRTRYQKCMDANSFHNAKKKCESLGGRLCTSKEVLHMRVQRNILLVARK